MGEITETINVKLEHIRELKARIAQIEDDVQKELQRSQPEEWEVKVKMPYSRKRSHTYFYIRRKNERHNLCHVYGDTDEAWERSVMISQTPKMVSLIREIAEQENDFTEKAKAILDDIHRDNWVISEYDSDRCYDARILDRKKKDE